MTGKIYNFSLLIEMFRLRESSLLSRTTYIEIFIKVSSNEKKLSKDKNSNLPRHKTSNL